MNKKKDLLDLLEIYVEFGVNFIMKVKETTSNIEKDLYNDLSSCTVKSEIGCSANLQYNTATDNVFKYQLNQSQTQIHCCTNHQNNDIENIGIGSHKLKQLSDLKKELESFDGCPLKTNANNTVFSDGNCNSQIMLIGEAPGANEDLEGIPFCGASGKLLDKMLASISLNRNTVYITNTVFWRPPNNRRPTVDEVDSCRPFLERHIAIINPKLIVLVGSTAANSVMNTNENISRIRGKLYSYTNKFLKKNVPITAIFHPAYLMRQPMQKKLAWEDLKLIRDFLETNNIT